MRKLLLVAGMVAATAIPTLAFSATRCEQQQAARKTTGTVLGAVVGGLLGNAVSHGGGKTGGTIIGAGAGAVVGNQLARQNNACPPGYTAYDDQQGPAYRDPAAYYGSDDAEDRYYRRYGHHSDGYIRYQNDMAMDARAYAHDTSAYTGDDHSWRDSNGRLCNWRDEAYTDDNGHSQHRWMQDCR